MLKNMTISDSKRKYHFVCFRTGNFSFGFEFFKDRKGSVLIVVIWIMVIFSLLFASSAFLVRNLVSFDLRMDEYLRKKIDCFSILNIVEKEILSDGEPKIDSFSDKWRNIALENYENYEVDVRDCESKLNINMLDNKMIDAFFEVLDDEGIDYSADESDFKEDFFDYKAGISDAGRKWIMSLNELLSFDSVDSAFLNLLEKYFYAYPCEKGVSAVNLNTAGSIPLKVLIMSLPGDAMAKKKIAEHILDYRDEFYAGFNGGEENDRNYPFVESDLRPYEFLKLIGVVPDVKAVSVALLFLRNVTLDSNLYGITIYEKRDGEKKAGIFEFEVSLQDTESSMFFKIFSIKDRIL